MKKIKEEIKYLTFNPHMWVIFIYGWEKFLLNFHKFLYIFIKFYDIINIVGSDIALCITLIMEDYRYGNDY